MLRVIILYILVAFTLAAVPKPRSPLPQLDGRIVGGQPATIEQYPHQLSLQYYGSHICGASIISSTIALTAAHCTDGSSASILSVRAGSSYRGSGGQVVNVARINQNPGYSSRTTDYDVSILHLSRALSFGAGVNSIGLPMQNQDIPVGTNAVVSGWGKLSEGGSSSTQLQAVSLPIVSQTTCKSAYGSSRITPRMICAGYTSGGRDACQGDSGGPLISGGLQIGVVSWGYGCARPYYPGVYASVSNLRGFIQSVSGV